jgi:hypothetical protein
MGATEPSVQESIRAFSKILESFELEAGQRLSVRGAPMLPYDDVARSAEAVSVISPKEAPLFTADRAIVNICREVFAEERTDGLGDLTWRKSQETSHRPSRLDHGAIFIVPEDIDQPRLVKATVFSRYIRERPCLSSRSTSMISSSVTRHLRGQDTESRGMQFRRC